MRKAERALRDYEEKLGLVSRFARTGSELSSASDMLDDILEKYSGDSGLCSSITAVRDIIDNLKYEL